jgi:hypothetical protein
VVPLGQSGSIKLEFRSADKTFDPQSVYAAVGDKPIR